MKIKNLKVHNWRSIGSLDIDFQSIMIFIGRNNHGKSNVLSALLFFFGEISCTDLDFKRGTEELYVEVTFSNLDEHDKKQFSKYLTSDNEIMIRKEIVKGSSFEYHGYCETPSEEWLKEENIGDYTTLDKISATPLREFAPSSGRITKDIVKQTQEQYIDEHREDLEFNYNLEVNNFLGLKAVAQGIFGEVFFIPAVKNASDEFNIKSKSIFNKLLSNVINEMSADNQEYIDVKDKITKLTENLNKKIEDGSINENRPEQLIKLEEMIEGELEQWNTKIDIEITPPDIDEVLKIGTTVWVDDGVPTDVSRKGHGLQRGLIFALITAWAKVLKQEREKRTLEEGESTEISKVQRRASDSNYYIFEEPELYLHPQAQRELYVSLNDLAEVNNQVILSTHSSSFISMDNYKSICIISKDSIEDGTRGLQCTEELFTLADDNKNFNLTYWVNPDRGELFFAKKSILVEGATDKTVIPFLAQKLGIFKYDYSIIDCGSKDSIKIYMHLLNKFNLNYVVVYDKDHQSHKDQEAINSADVSSAAIESGLDGDLGLSVILDNDIEEEIGITGQSRKGKPYAALQHVSGSDYVITEGLETKIKDIYQ